MGLSKVALPLGLIALLIFSINFVAARPASASTVPHTDLSYYIEKLDTASAQSIGCNQAHYDAGNGYRNSTITLDFGAQEGSSGTELPFGYSGDLVTLTANTGATFTFNLGTLSYQ